jgi:hypothetical protein
MNKSFLVITQLKVLTSSGDKYFERGDTINADEILDGNMLNYFIENGSLAEIKEDKTVINKVVKEEINNK